MVENDSSTDLYKQMMDGFRQAALEGMLQAALRREGMMAAYVSMFTRSYVCSARAQLQLASRPKDGSMNHKLPANLQ